MSTSSYSIAVSGNGSLTTNFESSSRLSPTSSYFKDLAAVTSISGPNGNITTSRKGSAFTQIPSRAGATPSTAAATENNNRFATTASVKATTIPGTTISSGFSGTKTSVGTWPATISFCSLSDGVPTVRVGYITSLANGRSSVH